jgi:hypothetical protein
MVPLYRHFFPLALCVPGFANVLDEIEFFAPFIPDGYADFTWGAMIGVLFALVLTFAEIIWIRFKKTDNLNTIKRHDLNMLSVPIFSCLYFFQLWYFQAYGPAIYQYIYNDGSITGKSKRVLADMALF